MEKLDKAIETPSLAFMRLLFSQTLNRCFRNNLIITVEWPDKNRLKGMIREMTRDRDPKPNVILPSCIHCLYQGKETFTVGESTELFHGVINICAARHSPSTRLNMYLAIKEMEILPLDVVMISQSTQIDAQKNEAVYRANAIRALRIITEQGFERLLGFAIVSKDPSVLSATLVLVYHMASISEDNRKGAARWLQNIRDVFQRFPGGIQQYHALGLLYMIKQNEHSNMGVLEIVRNYDKKLQNAASICLLIRYACKANFRDLPEFLEGYLSNSNEMVKLEAARAICEISTPDSHRKLVTYALQNLKALLASGPTSRLAAIRVLQKLSITNPRAVSKCNDEIEKLINDKNRTIAIIAIQTFFKTCDESSVDRMIRYLSDILDDAPNDFRVVMVEFIRSLSLKHPTKQASIMSLLNRALRDEGGYDYKKSIVETMFDMMKNIPESKDAALSHLCEFIEDCEFTKLSVRILHQLGTEGPKTKSPTKFIRYIYNRVILENATIRAAAVSALAKFGVNVDDPLVKKSVQVLLKRCTDDSDDEVRDRATFYLTLMGDHSVAKQYLEDEATFELPALEHQLQEYVTSPLQQDTAFDLGSVQVISKAQEEKERRRTRKPVIDLSEKEETKQEVANDKQPANYEKQLHAIPQFSSFGPLFKSTSEPIELNEDELHVACIKHTFAEYMVFQFNCTSIMDDQLLDVNVDMYLDDDDEMTYVTSIPVPELRYNVPGTVYVAFKHRDFATPLSQNVLVYKLEKTGEDETVEVEDLKVDINDYIRLTTVSDFDTEWENMDCTENFDAFELEKSTTPNLKAACDSIMELLGMQALDDSALPTPSSVRHTLYFAGTVLGGEKVLVQCKMLVSDNIMFEVHVKCNNQSVSDGIIDIVTNS